MARAIHAKELMLQEKLWRVEEKIRQRIQEGSVDQKSEEERPNMGQAERGKAQAKTRLSDQQRREPVRSREMMQERQHKDVKELRKRQDHRNMHTMRNTHEEERARWKSRTGTRRTGGGGRDSGIWGETDVKAKERELNTTSVGDKGRTREKKCRERTYEEMYSSDDERDMPQISQQKTSHRAVTENHTGARRKLSGEPLLPPVSSSSHASRPEQGEDRLIDATYDGLQLLSCRICNRKFASKRLEVHVQICKKIEQSHRQVFNSYANRTRGSAIEEFWKTHSRTKSPEVGQ